MHDKALIVNYIVFVSKSSIHRSEVIREKSIYLLETINLKLFWYPFNYLPNRE